MRKYYQLDSLSVIFIILRNNFLRHKHFLQYFSDKIMVLFATELSLSLGTAVYCHLKSNRQIAECPLSRCSITDFFSEFISHQLSSMHRIEFKIAIYMLFSIIDFFNKEKSGPLCSNLII